MQHDWRCGHCGKEIGVYEPLIVIDGEEPRRSSRLLEVERGGAAPLRYHESCWRARRG